MQQLLLKRTQNSVFKRDVKTPVFLCKDGLCSVHMNHPKQQVRIHHLFLTVKHRRTGNGSIFLPLPNREAVLKGVLLHPAIPQYKAFDLCVTVIISIGTF